MTNKNENLMNEIKDFISTHKKGLSLDILSNYPSDVDFSKPDNEGTKFINEKLNGSVKGYYSPFLVTDCKGKNGKLISAEQMVENFTHYLPLTSYVGEGNVLERFGCMRAKKGVAGPHAVSLWRHDNGFEKNDICCLAVTFDHAESKVLGKKLEVMCKAYNVALRDDGLPGDAHAYSASKGENGVNEYSLELMINDIAKLSEAEAVSKWRKTMRQMQQVWFNIEINRMSEDY